MTNVKRLAQAIAKSGRNEVGLAVLLSLSHEALSAKLQGRAEFTASEMITLVYALGLEERGREAEDIFFAKTVD